jgi:RHS repeat-associated protein
MDNLTYAYSGNRLNSVSDAISTNNELDFVPRGNNAYTYYPNGALKSDANEQIANIVYNTYLNQPSEVFLTDGRKIKHHYDGSGTLFKTEYFNSSGTVFETYHYIDGLIYKNGAFFQIGIPEGRVIFNNGAWHYEFDYKDHLGNTRASLRADGNTLVQAAKTDFDPFGVILKSSQANSVTNFLEYQDKLTEKIFGLNRINLGARNYNPTIGRMDNIDAMGSHPNQVMFSLYSANWNNPVVYTDPDGNCPSCPQGEDAAKVYSTGANVTNKDGSWTWTGSEWQDAPVLKQKENSIAENWSQGNFAQQVGYGFADGLYSMFADKHLNGYAFDSYDDKMTTKTMGLLSLLGPLLGEAGAGANVAKAATAEASSTIVEQVAVHGNSLKSLKPTWGYKLYSQDGTFLKNGITNKLMPESRYTRAFMEDKKMVPFKQFSNRMEAYQWEYNQNKILRGPLNLNMH